MTTRQNFILTKVQSSSVATEPKDLEKGLGFVAVIESTQRLGDVVVPLSIKLSKRNQPSS
ncbi:MAG: hypothetical protein K1X29_02945 [Bdellovibrionales bacterium]|nr:hypothetical protein [Bdellovibrionales bacterium]